jgi:hypothetical protein
MSIDRDVDPETSDFLTPIMEDAWREADGLESLRIDPAGAHAAMVRRLVEAVDEGELNQRRLLRLALAVARTHPPPSPTVQITSTSFGTGLRHFTKLIALMVRFTT